MEEEKLKLIDRRLEIDSNKYKNEVSKISNERALVYSKINKVHNEFKKIKDKIKKLSNLKTYNYRKENNTVKNYLIDLNLIGKEFSKLKVELSLKQDRYTNAIQGLKKIKLRQGKIEENLKEVYELKDFSKEESFVDEISSITQSLSNNINIINSGSIERNDILQNNTNLIQYNTSQNLISNEDDKSINNLSLNISDKIEDIRNWQNSSGKGISFSYSTSNNNEIKINLYNSLGNNYSIILIPSLLREKLKIWNNSQQITKAFNDAGIKLNSLKIFGRGRNV